MSSERETHKESKYKFRLAVACLVGGDVDFGTLATH